MEPVAALAPTAAPANPLRFRLSRPTKRRRLQLHQPLHDQTQSTAATPPKLAPSSADRVSAPSPAISTHSDFDDADQSLVDELALRYRQKQKVSYVDERLQPKADLIGPDDVAPCEHPTRRYDVR